MPLRLVVALLLILNEGYVQVEGVLLPTYSLLLTRVLLPLLFLEELILGLDMLSNVGLQFQVLEVECEVVQRITTGFLVPNGLLRFPDVPEILFE